MVCIGLRWFGRFLSAHRHTDVLSPQILVVICGGLRWFVVVCLLVIPCYMIVCTSTVTVYKASTTLLNITRQVNNRTRSRRLGLCLARKFLLLQTWWDWWAGWDWWLMKLIKKVCFYIAQYRVSTPLARSKRFTLFLPWQTCSFRHQLGFSWKHSSQAAITRNDYSLTCPPLCIARYSFIQLSRLRCCEENENAQILKR